MNPARSGSASPCSFLSYSAPPAGPATSRRPLRPLERCRPGDRQTAIPGARSSGWRPSPSRTGTGRSLIRNPGPAAASWPSPRGYCDAHLYRLRHHGDTLAHIPIAHPIRGDTWTRFLAKVDQAGPIPRLRPELGPCWLWTASLKPNGYGAFRHQGRMQRAHRVAYELLVGPIPVGLQLDHLCRTLRCVNPAHLEPVTGSVNIRRGTSVAALRARQTHCKHGHPFDETNTYLYPNGVRECRTCRTKARRARTQRGKAA
jgi:hypothetical protein